MKILKKIMLVLVAVLMASTMFAANGKNYNSSTGKYANAEADISIGDDFFGIGEYAEALKHYDKALSVIDTSRIYKKIGLSLFFIGKREQSYSIMEIAYSKDSSNESLKNWLIKNKKYKEQGW